MWTRHPEAGERCRDLSNDRVGTVVRYDSAYDVVVLQDRDGEWEAPLEETTPAGAER